MNAMAGGDSTQNEAEGGPMWGRFFDSIGHDDDGSVAVAWSMGFSCASMADGAGLLARVRR